MATARRSAARDRLVEAAARIFYAEGVHAIGVDRVIEDADISRATFYRHFRSKDELVRAYVEAEDQGVRANVEKARARAEDPRELLERLVSGLGDQICGAGFRGCPFINAAVEYPDPEHPVRQAVRVHRDWFAEVLADLAVAAGIPAELSGVLVFLRDGAMVGGYLEDPETVREQLKVAVRALVR
ncbi:TetR/AcrR family transcriptional regulator [Amycolatopsis sp. 195334CR]|uniref:TetR/AcrR family transcriptional regulator n=1 Tax=Amycolatopsis sp. 195334CR TaxID=2814588 RepID=UPI001A9000F7|nr:TetR/AcrR family transcriptional regulator [Amycolatopsis sp. 195334CR]MBN6034386.1 TetR/AcrR family transcriptional regulator [Amycolatopsis sp. 195334CR]